MTIRLFNPNPGFDLTGATFTNSFPANLFVATPLTVTNTCGGTVNAVAGGTSVGLTGGTIPRQTGPLPGECVITVNVTSVVAGNIINEIEAGRLFTAEGETNSTPASATLTVSNTEAITLTKLMAPNTFFSGNTSVLTFNVTNNDPATTLTNVTFPDIFPPQLTVFDPPGVTTSAGCGVGINVTATPGTSQVNVANASIAPGATCQVSVTVTQTTTGTFVNDILERTLTSDQGVTNRSTFTNYSVQANNLNITKNFAPNRLDFGQAATLTISLRNPNPSAPAPIISIQDNLPAGLAINNPSGATITCGANPPTLTAPVGGTQVLLTGGEIPPNNAVCDVTVSVVATRGGVFTNSIGAADVQAGNGFAWTGNATATVRFRGMTVAKSFIPSSINPGQTSTLRVTFTNISPNPVAGITVTDNLPANVTIAGAPVATNCGPGVATTTASSVTLSNATLPGSASPACFVDVPVTSNTLNTSGHLNTIGQDTAQIDVGGTLVPFPHQPASARLFVVPVGGGGTDAPLGSKTFAPATIAVGQPATLTLTIRAPGGNLQNVNFTDNLPAGLTITNLTTIDGTGCGVTDAALRLSSTLTSIRLVNGTITGAGGTCVITATVTTTNPVVGAGIGTYTNQMGAGSVTAVAVSNPGTPLSNVDAFFANLAVNANISGVKSFAQTTITANGTTAMTIRINAINGVTMTNVGFDDIFSGGLIIANPPNLVVTGCGTPAINGGNLSPGDTSLSMVGGTVTSGTNCTVTVNVTAPSGNGLINNAIAAGAITATFPGGAPGQNNAAVQASLTVNGLTVSKAFQPDTIGPGGRSTLVITLRNFSTQPLSNLSVTDNLPSANPATRWLRIANPALAQTTCGTGVVTAVPGTTTISLTNGQIVGLLNGVEGICTIVVDVVPQNHTGPYVNGAATNTINAGQVTGQTPGGQIVSNPSPASANLNFSPLTINANKSFNPLVVTGGGFSTLTVSLSSPNGVAITGVQFTDNLPTGMIVFSPPSLTVSASCGTTYTATGITAGSNSFTFNNLTIPATGTCNISVRVTSERSGNLTNTIPANGVTSTSGATNTQPASASLTYTPGLGLLKIFDAATINVGGTSTVRIRINNTNPFTITNINLTDTFPAGVTVAAPLTTNHNCGVGASVTATVGGSTVALNGGTLTANGTPTSTCEFSVVVTSNQPGSYTNDIPPSSVTAIDNVGNPITNTNGVQATLNVNAIYSLGNRVWDDTNGNGFIDGGEVGIGNVLVRLLDSTGTTQLATTNTDANGYYRFDNLQAGTYVVDIAVSNFGAGGPLQSRISTLTTEANPNADGDSNDNGIDSASPAVNGIRSGPVTLGPGNSEPTNEPDLGTGNGAPDDRSNLTVDFGFTSPFSLGNRVWTDTNNNGLLDGGEVGIGNMLVRLLDVTGTTQIATTTTDANGYYRFDNLAPGSYVVELAATNFQGGGAAAGLTSSTPTEANPNADTDNNDNGINTPTPAVNGIRSGVVTLGPGTTEPTAEPDLGTGNGAADNQSNLTVDFGLTPTYSVGNRVWTDTNANGLLDGAEAGVANVLVRLMDSTGTVQLATTTTNATGYYRFDNLQAGNYVVEVAASNFIGGGPLFGRTSSVPTEANPNADVDNNDNGIDNVTPAVNGIRSGTVTLGPGNSEPINEPDLGTGNGAPDNRGNLTVDFGFITPTIYSLGNRVWIDTNNNGLLDGGETGVANVLVRLMDSTGTTQIATTTTNANGYYRFDNLLAGDYIVEVAASNFGAGAPLVGRISTLTIEANPNTDGDNNDNGIDNPTPAVNGIRSGTVTLGPGTTEPTAEPDAGPAGGAPDNQSNKTVDFGFVSPPTFSLGNRVWIDTNANGLLDGGELGVANVLVRLLDSTGTTQIATTTTDANGYYRFDNLPAGDYVVEVAASNFTGAGPLFGRNSTLTTEANPNADGDNNDNGIDNAAPAVNGIRSGTVTLGPTATEPTAEPDAGPGSGAPDNRSNLTVDFGFVTPLTFSLGNRVWNDVNNNGLLDGGELGIANVLVRLLDSTGTTQIATTTTDANGYYRFDNLLAGDYIVEVAAANFSGAGSLVGRSSSTPTEASPNADVDNNDNGINNPAPAANGIRSGLVTLGPGTTEPTAEPDAGPAGGAPDNQSNKTVDFGFFPTTTYSLGNRVWTDTNADGLLNGGETGIANVLVRLLDSTGTTQIATMNTDANGYYRFDSLLPGDYVVEVAASNFTGAGPLVGRNSTLTTEANPNADGDNNDNGIDNPAPSVNGIRSGTVTLGPGTTEPTAEPDLGTGNGAPDNQSNLTVDFGFIPATTYSLGNRAWNDVNNNGLLDVGELGIANVAVRLLDSTGTTQIATTTTDANGYYRFDNLLAGDYIVEVAASNFSGVGPLVGRSSSTPTEATPNSDVDSNDNGINNPAPAANGIRSGTVTLGPGTTEPTAEPDAGPAGGAPDNQSNKTVDFGFFPTTTYSLGNRVWTDTNANGLLDGGEAGVGNVTVRLLDSTGATQIATMNTDANGYYRFDSLLPGDYIVEVAASNFTGAGPLVGRNSTLTTEANPNTDGDNNDNGIDNANPAANGIRSGTVTLGPGATEPTNEPDLGTGNGAADNQSNLTVDFGFIPATTFSLGNRVWNDVNNNGLLDGGELGIGGVTVRLLDSTGTTQIATTTTDANGYYRFDNLFAGDYIVEVAAANFTGAGPLVGRNSSTPTEATPNSDVDSNDNGIDNPTPAANGVRSGLVTLGPGTTEPTAEPDTGPAGGAPDNQSNLTVDFGFFNVPTFSLGNRVWNDVDNNGLIDAGEVGIGNVTVRLLDSTGTTQIATTTTDVNGYYRFDNLLPGDYVVEIPATNFSGGGPLAGRASSTPTEANPNSDVDSNDNGIDSPAPAGTGIRSGTVTLGPGTTEPTNEADLGPGGSGTAPNDRSNLSVDFGFTVLPTYSLGNRVWLDPNDNGLLDPGELGIPNVTVRLFSTANPTVALATTTTDTNGHYLFDNLLPGDYIVEVAASNFTGAGPLVGRNSSTPTEANPNADTDSNDNGINNPSPAANGVRSGTVTLGPGNVEPAGETDLGIPGTGTAPDNRSNVTVDFAFVQATIYSLGNRVWFDPNDNGILDPGETGIGGVTVNLLDGTGAAVIATTTTDPNGYYRFDNLLAGGYIVELPAANFAAGRSLANRVSSNPTEADPNVDTDSTDNGVNNGDPAVNGVRSGVALLGPATNEPLTEADPGTGNGAADNQSNLTVDFGFIPRPAIIPNPGGGGGAGAGGGDPNPQPADPGNVDPVIAVVADPDLVLPGDTLTFTILLGNNGTAPATGVVVTDPVPDVFDVLSAAASQGTFRINGNMVVFNVGVLNPGQVITLRITVRVRSNVVPPLDITNIAYLNYNEGKQRQSAGAFSFTGQASATVRITRGVLPQTGERPVASSSPLAWISLLAVILFAALALLRRRLA